jgi:hypothetical protein
MNERMSNQPTPQQTRGGFKYFMGNQEPPGLPQEAHVIDPLP